MPIAYIVDVEFLWGFQANVIGLSKTPPSFYYPPPTTFLGALAEALAKHYRLGEKRGKELIPKISQNLLAIGVKPVNCFPIKYEDINRIITLKLTANILYPSPKNLAGSFDAPARGKTALISLDNDPPMIRVFIVLKKDTVIFDKKHLELSEDVFWKIHRIGSKESRVSIIDVRKIGKLQVKEKKGVTNYSFPLANGVSPMYSLEGLWEYEIYVKPYNLKSYLQITEYIVGKNTFPFMIPLKKTVLEEPKYYVVLEQNLVLYKAENEAIIGYV